MINGEYKKEFYNCINPEKNLSIKHMYNDEQIEKGFLVCYVLNDIRRFALFENPFEFYQWQKNIEEKHFFECITANERKMIFDLNIDKKEFEQFGDFLISLVLKHAHNYIKYMKFYETKISFDDFMKNVYLTCSTGVDKYSFHIVLNEMIFDRAICLDICKKVANSVLEECQVNQEKHDGYKKILDQKMNHEKWKLIDASVYKSTQQIRLLGSCKEKVNNFKFTNELYEKFPEYPKEKTFNFKTCNSSYDEFYHSLVGKHDIEDIVGNDYMDKNKEYKEIIVEINDVNEAFKMMETKLGENVFEVDEYKVKNGMIPLNRIRRGFENYCSLCDETHSNDNASLMIHGKQKTVIFYCHRNEKNRLPLGNLEMFEEIPENNLDWTKEPNDKGRPLIVKEFVKMIEQAENGTLNISSTNPNAKILDNERYCPDFPVKDRMCYLLKSQLNTGKSTQTMKHFNIIKPKRACMLTSRRTFAISSVGELKKKTFVGNEWKNYLDDEVIDRHDGKSIHEHNYLVISIDSLYKLQMIMKDPKFIYDYLILDEIESLLYQFHSETLGEHEADCIKIFEKLITSANQVIACDGYK